MYCRNCGKEIANDVKFCPACGSSQEQTPQQPVINIVNTNANVHGYGNYIPKHKWTAFWLCFFLGYFGAHRFYVGKSGTGVLWLFTCGMFGIGWLIDLIVILCCGFRDKMGQPLI